MQTRKTCTSDERIGITPPKEHCFWVWYNSPVNGESYLSVLKNTPEEALKAAGKERKKISRVFDCYDLKNYEVFRGTIIN